VKEGDSLWKIANKLLGDGARYKDISRLNANILNDEDNLVVGMRLMIPAL
jgi:nucleoid-associated protein YgaU